MVRRKPNLVDFTEAGFTLTDELRRALGEKFPRVDLDATLELFADKARARGWVYADWSAAFRNYIRNGDQYGGVAYKAAMRDKAFDPLIEQAKAIGFRMPLKHESAGAYRTALHEADRKQAASAIGRLGGILKRVEK